MIRVSGFSVERFVNLAAFKGIYIWDICPDRTGVLMKVDIKGFKALKECARKTKCRYVIVEKRGLPFTLHRYKKRKILAAGVLFFILGLYGLSSFVWVVEVTGNERIKEEEILSYCQQLGLAPGKLKFGMEPGEISEELIQKFEDISWVSVSIQGTNAQIQIVETIPKTEVVDRQRPQNVVAAKDGVIESIAVSAGTPLVKAGDVVEQGDTLVSGEVIIRDADTEVGREYTAARAEVTARLWYEFEESTPLEFEEKVYSGEYKTDRSFLIGDSQIDFIKPNVEEYDQVEVEIVKQTPFQIGDYVFPIALRQEAYREYTMEPVVLSEQEAQKVLDEAVEEKIKETLPEDAQIADIQKQYERSGNSYTVKATVTVIERIDQQQPFTAPISEQGGMNDIHGTMDGDGA